MPSASWLNGWLTGDVVLASELSKSSGSFFDSTLGASAASFDITSVPTWGSHLRIQIVGRSDAVTTSVSAKLVLNNDTAAHYLDAFGQFTDAAVIENGDVALVTFATVGAVVAASGASGYPSILQIDVPNFRGTTFNKLVYTTTYGVINTGTGQQFVRLMGAAWTSTAAITRLTFSLSSGNWVAGSRCTAYVLGP